MEKNYFISFLTHIIQNGNQKDKSMLSMNSSKKIEKRQQVVGLIVRVLESQIWAIESVIRALNFKILTKDNEISTI
jgi:hypothetical protein